MLSFGGIKRLESCSLVGTSLVGLPLQISSFVEVCKSWRKKKEKKREYYKNAKLISKYKKTKKQQSQSSNPPQIPIHEDGDDNLQHWPEPHHKGKKRTAQSLKEEYEKKRAEDEKAKKERDVIIQAKREQREKSEAKRRELREKMFKKTRSGQPVMKYRIEHLLETALES